MSNKDKTKEELIIDLHNLQQENDSLKELYEKEINELRQTEKALVQEQYLMDVIMNNLPDHIYFKDRESRFIRINKDHAKSFGLSDPSQAVGKTDFDFFTEEHALQAYEDEQRVIQTGQPFSKEEKLTWPDRPDTWSTTTKLPMRDKEGNIIGTFGISKDITERKLAEEAFRKLSLRQEAILSAVPEIIMEVDNNKIYKWANRPGLEFFGNDVIGKEASFYFEGEQEIYNQVKPLFSGAEDIFYVESWQRRYDGEKRLLAWWCQVLKDDDGNVTGAISSARDVTEIKKVHEKLAEERNLLLALINNMPDRIYVKDNQSRFVICNSALVKLMGLSSLDDVVGKTDFDLVPQDLAVQYFANEQEILRTGQPLINQEECMGNISGTLRWNLSTKVPLHDSKDNIIGIVGIGRDITERKRKELESQVLFEIAQGITLTNKLDELLKLIHSSLGKVVYAENCFVALFNQKTGLFNFPYFVDKVDSTPLPTAMRTSCSAYVFRTNKPLLLTQDIFDQLLKQNEVELVGSNSPSWIGIPLQTPSKVIGVLVLQHYDKENVYSESDVRFLISVGTQIAISIERKQAEEEIMLKNELLMTINAEKDKFFSIIAHDLRGPLSAFVDATQIITEDIQNMTLDEIRDITMSMKNDASNIYKLLENLLEWSRLQRGVMEFNPQKLQLSNIINKSVASVTPSAKIKCIGIDVIIHNDIEITADEHMFETVVRNLVSNAVKFTPGNGKVTVTAAISPENLVEIRVTDTGIGMTPELKTKLFIMNEKTNRPGTAGEPSSGLGLLLCKEFIEKHGGKISVESKVGEGSTFFFSLPV